MADQLDIYDRAIDQLGDAPEAAPDMSPVAVPEPAAPVDPYAQAIDMLDADEQSATKQSILENGQSGIDPTRQAEALRLSKKHGVPVEVVYGDIDQFREKPGIDSDKIFTDAPAFSRLLADPVKGPALFPEYDKFTDAERALKELNDLKAYARKNDQPNLGWGMLTPKEGKAEQQRMLQALAEERKTLEGAAAQANLIADNERAWREQNDPNFLYGGQNYNPESDLTKYSARMPIEANERAAELYATITPTMTRLRDQVQRTAQNAATFALGVGSGGIDLVNAVLTLLPKQDQLGPLDTATSAMMPVDVVNNPFFAETSQFSSIGSYAPGRAESSPATLVAPEQFEKINNIFDDMQKWVLENIPADKARDEDFVSKLNGGLISAGGFLAAGWLARSLGVSSTIASAATGALSGASEGSKDAAANNATPDQQAWRTLIGGLAGISEIIPVEKYLGWAEQAGGPFWQRLLAKGFEGITVEGGQELGQGLPGDIYAKLTYDPERNIFANAWENFAVGGTVGAIFGAISAASDSVVTKRKEALDRYAEIAGSTNTAQVNGELLEEHLAEMKKAGTLPEAVTAPVEAVEALFQTVDPQTQKQVYGEFLAKIEEARASGSEVSIPSEKIAQLARLEGFKTFTENVRTDPDAPTVAEQKKLQEDIDRVLSEMDLETAPPASQTSPVFTTIQDQLVKAGQSADVAAPMAKLYEAFFTTQAQRIGMRPEDLLRRYGLEISSSEITAEQLGPQLDMLRKGATPETAGLQGQLAAAGISQQALGSMSNEQVVQALAERTMAQAKNRTDYRQTAGVDYSAPLNEVSVSTAEGNPTGLPEGVKTQPLALADGTPVTVSSKSLGKLQRFIPKTAAVRKAVLAKLPEVVAASKVFAEAPDSDGNAAKSWRYAASVVDVDGQKYLVQLSLEEAAGAKGEKIYALHGFEAEPVGAQSGASVEGNAFLRPPTGSIPVATAVPASTLSDSTQGPRTQNLQQVLDYFKTQPQPLFQRIDEQGDALADNADQIVAEETTADIAPAVDASSLDAANTLSKSRIWDKGRQLKQAIQDTVVSALQKLGLDPIVRSGASVHYLTTVGVKDALAALEQNPNAIGWYDVKTRQALTIMGLVHPEILKDENARFAFTWALAVTSNGIKVGKNFELADEVYKRFKADGRMPSDIRAGNAQAAINDSLHLFNELRDRWGMDNLRKFMLTDFTVKEITGIDPGLKPSGEAIDEVVRGAAVLGPKIGNGFFSNLYGNFDALTMDRWLVRTWGRWTGTLIELDQPNIEKSRARLTEAVKGLDKEALAVALRAVKKMTKTKGETEVKPGDREALISALEGDDLEALASAVNKASMEPKFRSAMNEVEGGEELRLAGNSLAKYLDGQKEQPGGKRITGPNERRYIREVFNNILANLKQDPRYADLKMADLQAVLWYAEKRLYETAKEDAVVADGDVSGYEDEEAPDYANAAAALARATGVSDRKINAALKREAENGRPAAARPGDAGTSGADGQAVAGREGGQQGQARGFTGSEKRSFIQREALDRVRSNRSDDAGQSWSYAGKSGADGARPRVLKALGVTYVAEWKAGKDLATVFRANGMNTPVLIELETGSAKNAAQFVSAISEARASLGPVGEAVYIYPEADYADMRLFVTQDGKSGFALKPDGDIVSVFSAKGSGNGRAVMETAIAAGGKKLDCFATILPAFYSDHGFRGAARLLWDDSQAPPNWDKAAMAEFNNGEPDVVFMAYDPAYKGVYSRKETPLKSGDNGYDMAVRAQERAMRAVERAAASQTSEPPPGGSSVSGTTLYQGGVNPTAASSDASTYGEPAVRIGDRVFKPSDYFPGWTKGTRPEAGRGGISIADEQALGETDLGPGMPDDPFYGHMELKQEARKALGADVVDAFLKSNLKDAMGFVNAEGDFRPINDPRGVALYQGGANPTASRGFITFNDARDKFRITLTGQANLSTFLHESGHFFLEVLQDVAERGLATDQQRRDLTALREWMGLEAGQKIGVPQHEKFARGFEAYLMEGKAPSAELTGVFQKFKSWLVFVYRSLAGLNVKLTDEVRGVMDRLLASDQAIQEARAQVGWRGQPMSQEATGLTDAEYQAYTEAWIKANDAQSQDADARVMLEAARELKKVWRDEKIAMTKAAEAELAKTRGYRAWKLLESGEGLENVRPDWSDMKIDPASIPSEWRRDAAGLTSAPTEGGLPLDDVAEILGFKSGEEMLSLIAGARAAQKAIPARVRGQMEAKHGKMDANALALEASKAVHNKPTMDVLLTEFRAMATKARQNTPKNISRTLAAQAEAKVAELTQRQLEPAKWRRAELKAATEAGAASARGDATGAFLAKRRQMVAAHMHKATLDAIDRIEKVRDYLATFQTDRRRAQLGKAGGMYLDGVDQILEAIELKDVSLKLLKKRPMLQEIVEKAIAEDEPINIPPEVLGLGKKNYSQLTLGELEAVHDAVKNLWTLAKLKNELKTRQGKIAMDKAMAEIEKTANDYLGQKRKPDNLNPTAIDSAINSMRWVRAKLVKMEFLFGWLDGKPAGGLAHQLIYQPIADARAAEYKLMKDLTRRILDPIRGMPREQRLRWDTKRQFMGQTMKGANIIAVALNLGNEQNKQKLLQGYNWNEQQLVAELNQYMTKADWDMVQRIWDAIESVWPHIERVSKNATGLAPPRVVPTSVQTPFGEYSGGYYPIVYDPFRTQRMAEKQEANAAANGLFTNNFLRPTLANGFTKKRTSYSAPIYLSLDVLSQHLAETVHYVTHYEAVKQADKIRSHPTFQRLVTETMGREFWNEIRPWLQDIANNVTQRRYPELGEGFWRRLRIGTSIASMGFNIGTGIQQLFGITTALDAIGPRYWATGVRKAWLSPKAAENWRFALKESQELEPLIRDFDREVKQVNDAYTTSIGKNAVASVAQAAFWHIGHLQLVVNVATWHGAYEQAIAEGKSHAEAVTLADSAVRKTQSAGATKDLADVQRSGEATKLLTMFYSYFSVLYNRLEDIAKETKSIKDVPRAAMRVALLSVVPAMLNIAYKSAYAALTAGEDDEEEDDAPGLATRIGLESVNQLIGAVPLLRNLISFGEFGGTNVPAFNKLQQMERAATALKDWAIEGETPTRNEIRTTVNVISTLTQTPIYPIYKQLDDLFGEKISDALE